MASNLGLLAGSKSSLSLLKVLARNTPRTDACAGYYLLLRTIMAKVGNLQSGYQGKLDGQTYYKGADGKTVVRKITTPKNPKTLAQRVQRVITKTVGDNYKMMKAICDHSFEGRSMGFQCANRFRSLNANRIRERASYLQEQGISLYSYYNFSRIGAMTPMPAAVFVSEGTLNQVSVNISNGLAVVPVTTNTYQGVIDALGAQRGDQMTFVTVEKKAAANYEFHFTRVILDPRNENGAAELSVPFISGSAINCPNNRNKGSFGALSFDGGIKFKLSSYNVVAAGIIMSRKSDGKWFRSTCQLALDENGLGADKCSLMLAAEESDSTVQIDVESEQFLNNAGVGGSEGESSDAPAQDTTPSLSTTATINGANQSISGGSTTVQSLSSVVLRGSNLSGATFKMTKNGGSDVAPTSTTDTTASWTITGSANGDVYRFYMGDTLKLTVHVNTAGGGGDDEGDGN